MWGQNAYVSQAIYARKQTSACCQVMRAWLVVTGVRELTVMGDVDAPEAVMWSFMQLQAEGFV